MAASASVTWFGHATVLIETNGVRVLTDPLLRPRAGLLTRVAPAPPALPGDGIDLVLISHLHADHVDVPSLRQVGDRVPMLAPPAAAAWLRRRGFSQVEAHAPGDAVHVRGLAIEVTRASHDGHRWWRGGPAAAAGFLVQGAVSVYFAGDTDLFPEMAWLHGRVEVALLPISGWGPTLGPGHLDPSRAAQAAAAIRPRVAIPIHWGTLALTGARPSAETLNAPARSFVEEAAKRAPGVEVRVLAPGERTTC